MQKLNAKLSEEGLHGISETKGGVATASFTSPTIHPWMCMLIRLNRVKQESGRTRSTKVFTC